MLVFSTTDRASFEAVPAWKQKVSHAQKAACQTAHTMLQHRLYGCKGPLISMEGSEAQPAVV